MPTPRQPGFDLFARPKEPRARTVSELTREVKGLLEGKLGRVWVVGEVSGFRRQSSGHVYLTLKDDKASLQAVCFRNQARYLRFDPEDGMEVLVAGRLSVYAPRGQYQLVIDHMEPKGLGALQAAFEKLKQRLAAEGLFEASKKKPLPFLPRTIGVVTSPTGAAVHDFLRVLLRRNPNSSVLIAPAKVQGDAAAGEVASQLARLDARGDLDVLVVTRGGGSIEDLFAFNEEELARAIAACATPVVSAVGHEVDVTISDMVADLRAPTPSAAAELLMPEHGELAAGLRVLRERLERAALRRVEQRRSAVAALWGRAPDPRRLLTDRRLDLEGSRERLEGAMVAGMRLRERGLNAAWEHLGRQHPRVRLRRLQRDVVDVEARMIRAMSGLIRSRTLRFRGLAESVASVHPRRRIEVERGGQRSLGMRLSSAIARDIGAARRSHAGLAGKLHALSPLRVLQRGYALVRGGRGQIVRSPHDVEQGENLDIRIAGGSLVACVTGSKKDDGPLPDDDKGSDG